MTSSLAELSVRDNIDGWKAKKKERSLIDALQEEALERGLSVNHVADLSFREFVDLYFPVLNNGRPFIWHKHSRIIAEVLEDVLAGRKTRVMIWLPPRTGKSVLVSNRRELIHEAQLGRKQKSRLLR